MKVLLAGGGTAGHINPLIATAQKLRAAEAEVIALGTAKGLEVDLLPPAGIKMIEIPKVPAPGVPARTCSSLSHACARHCESAGRPLLMSQ